MNRLKWIVIGALLCLFSEAGAAGKDWVKYVNTLQGTNSSFELSRGNTYPAVAMPWGMNFWTPQTGENRNGFIYRYAEDIIRGFRQTHQCSPWANDYAAFSLMPVSGELKVTQHNRFRHFRHEDEIAQPHYYKVTLDNRITAEMSPTERGVFMRFTYPEGKDAYVVLDLNKSHNKIKIIPEQRKVVGYTTHASQAVPQGYANYFVIVFDQPIEGYGTWTTDEGKIRPGVAEEEGFFVSGYLKFAPGGQVNARVVSSFISEEQAEENFRQELAGVKDLEEVKAKAAAAWNKQLGKVEVEGGSEEDKATFYSCMYHSMLFPRQFYEYNQAGEPVYYSPYDGKVHKGYMFTDNGFWDTFRAQFPLNLLLHPEMHGRYLKSLLDAYDQSGWLPSWSCPGHSGGMIGNHAFSLLADAWVKGVRTFDPQQALKAMYHDATDKAPFGQSIGRSGWRDYYLKGYVPFGTTSEPTAKTLEYAYNDFCAMRLAQEVGNKTYERFFGKTIFNYRNVYDPESRFMRGRLPNGEWAQKDFDPTAWGGPFIEGNAWQYHWSVMHDIQGLIDLMGGESNFTAKLDSVFSVPNTVKVGTYGRMIHEMTEMMMIDMGQYAHGNQPVHHMIYLYNYAGEPVTAGQLNAVGAMAALLKDAIKPIMVQTLENTPALVHGGPFANIAHGCNSVRATKTGLKLADYVITEAGFGADLGAEKFFDIKCRMAGMKPDAVVLVATVRALKYNGGVAKENLGEENLEALKAGIVNLEKHIENVAKFKVPCVVTLNRFVTDTDAELQYIEQFCKERGCDFALSEVWEKGGEGGIALAKEVIHTLETKESDFTPLYLFGKRLRRLRKKFMAPARLIMHLQQRKQLTV